MNFYIFNNCPLGFNWMSGTDRRTYEWSRIFKKMGHQIQLFIHRAILKRYEGQGYNITVTSSINYNKWGIPISYCWNALKASLLCPNVKSNSVIYSSSDALPDVLPAIVMKLKNRRANWITGLHLIAPNPLKGFKKATTRGFTFPALRGLYLYFYQKLVVYAMKPLAQLIMVSNKLDKEFLIRRGIPGQKIVVVYGGINYEEVKKAKGKHKYDACFIGRVHPQKGISDLMKAWSLVCQKKRDAKLVLIGQLDLLREEVNKRGLDKNIEFLGYLDGVEKFQVLKSSKIFLLPSSYEGCALVACEAMACGLPVIAYDLPMLREVYPRGIVRVPVGDIERFAQEIVHLLEDSERRKRLSEEARELALEFSWEKTASYILARFTEI